MSTVLMMAAGWALLESLRQGAIAAAALGIVLAITKSPRLRYSAACFALSVLTLGFALNVIDRLPGGASSFPLRHIAQPQPWDLATTIGGFQRSGEPAVLWLGWAWMAGVLLRYARHIAGWIAVNRLRRRGVCAASAEWRRTLSELGARLGLLRTVELLESALVEAPTVLGHFRPVILLPVGMLTGWPVSQIEAILLHELAHVRRYDYLANLIERLAAGLMFYHPAVWWISSVIRTEREHCCDDLAVSAGGDAHQYATALTLLEANRQRVIEPALAATGGKSLMKRIERLLYPQRRQSGFPLAASLVLMIVAAVSLMAWPQQQQEESGPYLNWVNQDVVYIIQADEREAFLRLTSNQERNHFIEQFWLRRDPTPGTPENEFQEEHYRRIAYSNERFASRDLEGWRTDRGRTHIVYGPPDELESYTRGDRSSATPREDWRYRFIAGIGANVIVSFVDDQANGQFRMTRDPHGK